MINELNFRSACAIQFDDYVVLTGGVWTESVVSVYNVDGCVMVCMMVCMMV